MAEVLDDLERAIRRQTRGKSGEREASMALSCGGEYLGSKIVSPTKLLSVSAEEAALLSAVQHKDYEVTEVVTMRERVRPSVLVLPSVAQVMVTHARRTGREIIYKVFDMDGRLAATQSVSFLTPGYSPFFEVTVKPALPEASVFEIEVGDIEKHPQDLRLMALRGMERAFTLKQTDSRYGAAAVTASGHVFISGQYSGAEGGRTIHAEMGAIVSALTQNKKEITHIGLVSDKFPDHPADMCGACRQFLADAVAGTGAEPVIMNFASDSEQYVSRPLGEYLPSAWSV